MRRNAGRLALLGGAAVVGVVAIVLGGRALQGTEITPEPTLVDVEATAIAGAPTETRTPEALPTETAIPTATATSAIPWEGWPAPLYPSALTPIPYPLALDGPLPTTYVLFGSDFLPHRDSINTDATMIVLLWMDPAGENHVSVISIPRDLYVFVPGFGMSRVNSAYGIGGGGEEGADMALATVRYNLGVDPEGYALVDMAAFVILIDSLGGVDVQVDNPILDRCGDFDVNYLPGQYHMGGWEALCYARARSQSSDFDRLRRQQEVMFGVFRAFLAKMGQDPAGLAVDLFGDLQHLAEHNFNVRDIAAIALFGAFTPQQNVHLYRLVPPLVTQWTKPDTGAYLLVPPPPKCLQTLLQLAFEGQPWPESCP
jgi:LCP family protein required for cell wall assembly